mgnify:CR=1 FL=1
MAPCVEGLEVQTDTPRVQRARKVILELLHSTVDCSEAPQIETYSARFGADPTRFAGGERRAVAVKDDNPFYVRDYSKCILCWRCVQVCAWLLYTSDAADERSSVDLGGRRILKKKK